ncbi:hypothetical protein PybrP1_007935 [[Pythium] brassicae (nom. inval.)]|nr:hypothetical protein PybrP1_007935 [[Pythium] brassicae (nom. inval.)]
MIEVEVSTWMLLLGIAWGFGATADLIYNAAASVDVSAVISVVALLYLESEAARLRNAAIKHIGSHSSQNRFDWLKGIAALERDAANHETAADVIAEMGLVHVDNVALSDTINHSTETVLLRVEFVDTVRVHVALSNQSVDDLMREFQALSRVGSGFVRTVQARRVLRHDDFALSFFRFKRGLLFTFNDAAAGSWHRNVERRGGFWGNAYWYDLNLSRRMPLAEPMLLELVAALPPCDSKRVVDLCAGSGRAAAALLAAYPTAEVTLVDASAERLAMARKRLADVGADVDNVRFVTKAVAVGADTELLADAAPVDVVVGCLALHVLAERPAHYQSADVRSAGGEQSVEATYEAIFRLLFASLAPGGHLLFADHVGQLGLFAQLQLMASVGFVDVDCAWRQDDSFVAGGRRPLPSA